jgi:hypothetical protein
MGDTEAVIARTQGCCESSDDEYDEPVADMNLVRNMIMGKLKTSGREITVSLDRYFHTLDGEALDGLGNLDLSVLSTTDSQSSNSGAYFSSLRVALLQPPQEWVVNCAYDISYHGCASGEVDSLLRLHHCLRELYLEVLPLMLKTAAMKIMMRSNTP